MAQNTVYNWPVVNLQAVCKTQDVDAGDNLVLDGTMAISGAAQISFIRTGVSRSVSISSVNDLSVARFTVIGIQNGAGIVKNDITGPNAGTVYIDDIFDTITSVSVDIGVVGVQVGTGSTGFLPLLNADPTFSRFNIRNTNGSCALSVIPSAASVLYTVWTTLENIDNGIPFKNQLTRFFTLTAGMTDASTKQLYQATSLTNHFLVQVSSGTPATDSLDLIYMQS